MRYSAQVPLETLGPPQCAIWDELRSLPGDFVLYGGVAVAAYCQHRASADFDFFSPEPFDPSDLRGRLAFAADAELVQSERSTLTLRVDRGGPVLLSFFGVPNVRRPHPPAEAGGVRVADPRDLAGSKLAVITQRVEKKDYLDLDALFTAGVTVDEALASGHAAYGEQFAPAVALRALAYFGDGDLPSLPAGVQDRLRSAAAGADLAGHAARVAALSRGMTDDGP